VSRQFSRDFLIDVQRGLIPGHSMVHKFGRNDGVPSGSWVHVSLLPFAVANFRTSAATMRIKAGGNVADTAAAGAGAREVTIQGIDSTFVELAEAIVTNGALVSAATTASFWRVHRAWVSAAGAYTGNNTGIVTIEDSGGAADMMVIGAGEGQSQYTGWSVPAGKTAYLLSIHVTVDSNKTTNIRVFTRNSFDDVAVPFVAKRLKLFWDGIESPGFVYKPYGPELSIPEKSDIWVEAYGDGAVSHVSCDFELLCIDN